MLDSLSSRRDILKLGMSVSAIGLLAATGGCEALRDAIANRPVRRDVTTAGAANDVAIYRDAVTAMKALPASDPRNWDNQATIHLDFCPHGNWFFLPWHRAYLYYFERICREVTGEQDFALPYWNWQKDRAIPSEFWGAGNSLDHSPRTATATSQALDSWVGPQTMEDIFDLTNFEQFASYESSAPRGGTGGGYGSLEQTPHNNIHGFVGGTMGGYTSPLDPVFWCHHNMIDCCWVEWNINRQNANTNDSNWTSFTFTEFSDENGDPAEMSILGTVLMPLLSYRFEDSPKGQEPLVAALDRRALRRFLEVGGNIPFQIRRQVPVEGGIELGAGERASRQVRLPEAVLQTDDQRILLRASDITPLQDEDAFVRVFVNLPDASADTPTTDPHYAGSFAFFEDRASHGDTAGHRTADFYVDITNTVRRLRQAGEIAGGEPVSTQFVAVPYPGRQPARTRFALGSLDVVTTPAAIRGQ